MDYQTIRINAFEDYPSDLTLTSADIADSLPGNPVLNVIGTVSAAAKSPYNVYAATLENVSPGMDLEAMTFAIKISKNPESLAKLEREYGIYSQQLLPLQGTVVPICYGLFKGTFGETEIGCLILEYIESSPHDDEISPADEQEDAQELLYRISMIHAAGVVLNHPTGTLRTLGPHYDIKIIDFTEATIHVCHNVHRSFNSTPEEENEDEVDSESCLELTSIEKNISHLMWFNSLYEKALEEQNKCVAPRRSSVWSSWSEPE